MFCHGWVCRMWVSFCFIKVQFRLQELQRAPKLKMRNWWKLAFGIRNVPLPDALFLIFMWFPDRNTAFTVLSQRQEVCCSTEEVLRITCPLQTIREKATLHPSNGTHRLFTKRLQEAIRQKIAPENCSFWVTERWAGSLSSGRENAYARRREWTNTSGWMTQWMDGTVGDGDTIAGRLSGHSITGSW